VDQLLAGDPRQIGPFRLLGRLGEGGMGRVFLGESPGGRKVAVKVVHPHYASDPGFRGRFTREVAAARQVGGFHTAGVVGADPDADPPWMATAYIPGPSLAQAVAQGGPLDDAGVRRLGAALAEGLAAIHDCGLIHRDLKPGNVILADDGPRIIDFGIAKGADATALTGSSAVIGTLRYMSPEQLNGHDLTPHSDVFALGAVLAYAASGHDPFQAPTMPAVITRILTGPPDLDPIAGDLREVIAGCLAKDPASRPSPADLLARLSRPAPHDPTLVAAPTPAPAPAPVPGADPVPAASTASAPAPAPVPEAASSPEPGSAKAAGPASPAQDLSQADTVSASPVHPGRTDPPATGADLAAAPATTPPRLPGTLMRRRPRRRMGLIADVIIVVIVAAVSIRLISHYVQGHSSAAGTPPATSPAASTPAGNPLTATGKLIATLTGPAGDTIRSVVFGPDGTLSADDNNGSIYLWRITYS
jgi:serine/threonine protein kinase